MDIIVEPFGEFAKVPTQGYDGDAGWDVYANEDGTVFGGKGAVLIGTGLKIQIPQGYYAEIRDRSSMAIKGLHVVAGIIDAGYRDELMVALTYLVQGPMEWCPALTTIQAGDKIAQLIFHKVEPVTFRQGQVTNDTARGNSGFGSTGR